MTQCVMYPGATQIAATLTCPLTADFVVFLNVTVHPPECTPSHHTLPPMARTPAGQLVGLPLVTASFSAHWAEMSTVSPGWMVTTRLVSSSRTCCPLPASAAAPTATVAELPMT